MGAGRHDSWIKDRGFDYPRPNNEYRVCISASYPDFHRATSRVPDDIYRRSAVHHSPGHLNLGNPCLLLEEECTPFAPEGNAISVSQGSKKSGSFSEERHDLYLLRLFPTETSLTKKLGIKQPLSLHKKWAEMLDYNSKLSPNKSFCYSHFTPMSILLF